MQFRKIQIIILVSIICSMHINAQAYAKRYRVQIKVIDGRTKKGIKKIPVTVMPFNEIIHASNSGELLFRLPKDDYSFKIDYYPFDKKEIKFTLMADTTINIELQSPFSSQYIDEVEVVALKPLTRQPAGFEQIDNRTFRNLPAMIGERDILKALALSSGVTSSSEGAADLQVRGGVHGQNLYLLDGVPLYSTEHFFGMVSVYNPIIVKSAMLYKSAFPTEYGGKISSVVNVLTEDADIKKFSGAAEISLLSSKALVNIPIVKDKLAFAISGRISNYSILNIMSLYNSAADNNAKVHLYFADINANLLWKISDRDKLKLTWFRNSDGNENSNEESEIINSSWMDNRQQNLGLNWYRTISENMNNHLLVYFDSYNYDFGQSAFDTNSQNKNIDQFITGINSFGLDNKFGMSISDAMKLYAGVTIKSIGFLPTLINHTDTTLNRISPTNLIQQTEVGAYAETEYKLAEKQVLTTGLRLSIVGNAHSCFTNLEPRMAYHGVFTHDFSLNGSVSRMTQPIHRLANPGLGIPFEVFLPSGTGLLPESSWIYSVGAAKDFLAKKDKFSIKAEAWYKSMQNIAEFQDGYDAIAVMFNRYNLSQKTNEVATQGNGEAYGIDFSGNLTHKSWSVTADYTLMRAINTFSDLNNGKPFAAATDIRHVISATFERKFTTNLTLSATWQYHSGKPITVPTTIFKYPTYTSETGQLSTEYTNYMTIESERNNFRTKPFHKLDVTLTKSYKAFKRFDATYSLSVYNIYNNWNPYIYYISNVMQKDRTYKPVFKSMAIFPILPSFSWYMKF